jgi:cytoskeletal protein CcmA (bactofilin family)
MAWLKRTQTPPVTGGKIENLLGANTSYEGTLRSDGNIRIDGVFSGRIETAGNVILGPSARVLADIVANVVQVWGSIQGNIKTHGRLEILSNGRVWGDIDVASLLIDEGGMFRGQCLMAGQGVEEFPLGDLSSASTQEAVAALEQVAEMAPAETEQASDARPLETKNESQGA